MPCVRRVDLGSHSPETYLIPGILALDGLLVHCRGLGSLGSTMEMVPGQWALSDSSGSRVYQPKGRTPRSTVIDIVGIVSAHPLVLAMQTSLTTPSEERQSYGCHRLDRSRFLATMTER